MFPDVLQGGFRRFPATAWPVHPLQFATDGGADDAAASVRGSKGAEPCCHAKPRQSPVMLRGSAFGFASAGLAAARGKFFVCHGIANRLRLVSIAASQARGVAPRFMALNRTDGDSRRHDALGRPSWPGRRRTPHPVKESSQLSRSLVSDGAARLARVSLPPNDLHKFCSPITRIIRHLRRRFCDAGI